MKITLLTTLLIIYFSATLTCKQSFAYNDEHSSEVRLDTFDNAGGDDGVFDDDDDDDDSAISLGIERKKV